MSDSLTIYHEHHPIADTSIPDPHQDAFSKTLLGFWTYLMTDCILFGVLFVTYAVMHSHTFGGPPSKEILDIPHAFLETLILLSSSFTCGLAMLASMRSEKTRVLAWLGVTFILGVSFLSLELSEFSHLVQSGNSWQRSAFLSSFFTLVGTHGLHITVGLLWVLVMAGQLIWQDITVETFRRLAIFSLFWHFLDVIWIFIFTFVYLMGAVI